MSEPQTLLLVLRAPCCGYVRVFVNHQPSPRHINQARTFPAHAEPFKDTKTRPRRQWQGGFVPAPSSSYPIKMSGSTNPDPHSRGESHRRGWQCLAGFYETKVPQGRPSRDNANERRPKQERRKFPTRNAQFYCGRRYHLVNRGYASIRPKCPLRPACPLLSRRPAAASAA